MRLLKLETPIENVTSLPKCWAESPKVFNELHVHGKHILWHECPGR